MAFSLDVQKKIIIDNLLTQNGEYKEQRELRNMYIKDLVHYIKERFQEQLQTKLLSKDLDGTELLSIPQTHQNALLKNESILTQTTLLNSTLDKIQFATYIWEELKIPKETFIPKVQQSGKIAYYRTNATDLVLDAFSDFNSHLFLQYDDDYESSCLSVVNGEATYCILPYKNQEGSIFQNTKKLLKSHHLLVISTMDIYNSEEELTTFALVGKTFLTEPQTPICFLSIHLNDPTQTQDILALLQQQKSQVLTLNLENNILDIEFTYPQSIEIVFTYFHLFQYDYEILGLDNQELNAIEDYE